MKPDFSVIILAAGKGSRMKSPLPKVLHKINGKPMLKRTVEIIQKTNSAQIIIVLGFGAEKVKKAIGSGVTYVLQKEQLGTANAVEAAIHKVKKGTNTIVVLNGDDSAFYKSSTIGQIIKSHQISNSTLTFVTVEVENSAGLGRVVKKNGKVIGIVEERDASKEQKKIKEINDGLYVFKKDWLAKNLQNVEMSPVTGEYYLVELIKIAVDNKQKVTAFKLKDPNEWHGVNTRKELQQANLKIGKKIHIMGIAGAGAAAVAGISKAYGFVVSGCDLSPNSAYSQNLQIPVHKGHSKKHLEGEDMLIVSPAVEKLDPQNEELKAAGKLKIPVLSWQEFQGKFLQKDKFVITVAGAYGKSTTTAMIAQILIESVNDPTCEIGAKVLNWNSNFRVGNSKYYVCESDEYNNNFLNYAPDIAVVLNVAWDHPDFFKTQNQLLDSYLKFMNNIKQNGTLVISNDLELQDLSNKVRKDIRIIPVKNYGRLDLSIIGDFRIENANAALTVAGILGVDINKAKSSLSQFKGVGRRLEFKGQLSGVEFYDDYAVQPYTVLKTSTALKEKYKDKNVLLVFEPHTFSRINTFFSDFVKSLKESKVDKILITDLFAAREKGDTSSLSKKLVNVVGSKALYTGSLKQTANYVNKHLKDFDVVCSMGAGDSYKLYNMVLNRQ